MQRHVQSGDGSAVELRRDQARPRQLHGLQPPASVPSPPSRAPPSDLPLTHASVPLLSQVAICHRTAAYNNPYQLLTVDAAALRGHAGHTIDGKHEWADVIPAPPGGCRESLCGDGRLQSRGGETCDDGNTASGDGCSAACSVESDYTCSGGSASSSDSCERTSRRQLGEDEADGAAKQRRRRFLSGKVKL